MTGEQPSRVLVAGGAGYQEGQGGAQTVEGETAL
jgi:hypothetical protein